MTITLVDRYLGCLLGLACGDAVGTSVEFQPRGSFETVTGMQGGGPFALEPGYWTDDTSMALCLAESLCAKGGFDARDQMTRYVRWWKAGTLSSTGSCFDIGITVRSALERFLATGEPFAGATDPRTAGNGSLMRLAPVVLYYAPERAQILRYAAESSRTTHAAPEAIECCQLLALAIANALDGQPKEDVLRPSGARFTEPAVAALQSGAGLQKERTAIRGTGYCVASLEAALWCFDRTESFEAAVLEAANLGDDADTTAAIVGQLAGAFYGVEGIPILWRETLWMRAEIEAFALKLLEAAQR